jgi:translation initiation factor IF-2
VAGWKSKDRVRDDFQISTTSNDISTVGDTETAPERERRKSRFELEENNSQGRSKKSKQVQKKGRRGRHGDGAWDNDWDEAEIQRWEDKQRKQEEKKRRQQQQLMQDEPSATPIFLPEFISVSSLAQALKQRTNNFRSDMEEMGFENITDDTILTGDTAALISMEYGYEPTVDNGITRDLQPRPPPEDISSVPPRPPIVTIMGHVDHGKTTLLDWLRKSSIAAQEHGGITQHIGAFVVQMSSGKRITFLDTPGHAAFLSMRQRGANVTDIVILVVAADDSVMPQTIEAIKHATAAKVPMIVAINKIDKEDAKIEQVKADLSRHGVEIEDYGGDVQVVPVSGKTGQGMDDLEENIITLSEILDVRSEPDGMAEGWVLESSVKQTGRAATVLVKRGTLRPGDVIAAGRSWARIRSLRNEAGVEVSEAPPGTPVEILGWRDLPAAGEMVLQAPDEDKAKTAVEYRQEMADRQESSVYLAEQEQRQRDKAAAEAAASAAEADGEEAEEEPAQPGILYQNYTVRADVAGSVEAVCGALQELGNQEVQPRILRSMAGQVSEYDVDHAATSKSIIINFNSPVQPHIKHRAAEAGVRIIDHSVIYHLVDEVRGTLSDLLPMTITHRVIGEADVLQIFPINIRKRVYKNIAGCKIRNGAIKRSSLVKVLRKGKVVFDGKLATGTLERKLYEELC